MRKRSSNKRPDSDAMATDIVNQTINETPAENTQENGKNPAAVALGRLGGLKGGKARAIKLPAKTRREIAKKAAAARWKKAT